MGVAVALAPGLGCSATPDTTADTGSSGGETTTVASTSTESSASSTGGPVVDDSGSSSSSSSSETDTTGGPPPEPVCSDNGCFIQCTRELEVGDAQGQACTCIAPAPIPDLLKCEIPAQCVGSNDYTCMLEGLRDGVVGRYTWIYFVKDQGGETVEIQLLEPGRATALVSAFEENGCCGVQSSDTRHRYHPFALPDPADPYWVDCFALAAGIVEDEPAPSCLRPDMLRVGTCSGEPLTECPR